MDRSDVFVRNPFNYDVDDASFVSGVVCSEEEGKTQQQFVEESDINTIVRRFGLTGEMPEDVRMPQSGDFTSAFDFQSSMNVLRRAEEAFMELPAELRFRFGNDPGTLIGFLEDGRNRDEAIRLGLVKPPVEVDRVGAEVPGKPAVVPS